MSHVADDGRLLDVDANALGCREEQIRIGFCVEHLVARHDGIMLSRLG